MLGLLVATTVGANTLSSPVVYTAEETPPEALYASRSVDSLIDEYSLKYGVSASYMRKIIYCESGGKNVQSLHRYKRDYPQWGVKAGDRELSFGVVQIHLPSWPSISKEEALDPRFSVEFLAQKLSTGQSGLWTCSKLI